ncbi:MAG: hypothetical protein M1559_01000 [Candidatus Marsarchaeota archaeon]|nr:hypothetical protein [Candidatus Marsarchaeota archaeon]
MSANKRLIIAAFVLAIAVVLIDNQASAASQPSITVQVATPPQNALSVTAMSPVIEQGPKLSCPPGVPNQGNLVIASSETLSSDLCANTIVVDSGVVLTTASYSITAIYSFTNNGLILSGPLANGGSAITDLKKNGNGANGDNSNLGGGAGGTGSAQCPNGLSGSGGGGPGASGGSSSCYALYTWSTDGGSNSGGGGGGGGFSVGGGGGGAAGGQGAGNVIIYAKDFFNKGTIAAPGYSGGSGSYWGGGGGGAGYIELFITASKASNIEIGGVSAIGGSGGLISECSGNFGSGAGGGGGVIDVYVLSYLTSEVSGSFVVAGGHYGVDTGGCSYSHGSSGKSGSYAIKSIPPIIDVPHGCYGGSTLDNGYCNIYTNSSNPISASQYSGYAGDGSFVVQPSTSSTGTVIPQVLKYNSQDAQWLITCPMSPDPSNTIEYLVTSNASHIAGNRCLASATALDTIVRQHIYISWSQSSPANATVNIAFLNLSDPVVNNLGYSPQANMSTNPGNFVLSNGYDTQSYIFDSVPTMPQSAIWSWHARYADLSKVNVGPLHNQTTLKNLYFYTTPSGGTYTGGANYCNYTYDYTENSIVDQVTNAFITIPVDVEGIKFPSYLLFQGSLYQPATVIKRAPSAEFSCASDLYYNDPGKCPSGYGLRSASLVGAGEFFYGGALQPGDTPASPCLDGSCLGNWPHTQTVPVFTSNAPSFQGNYIVARSYCTITIPLTSDCIAWGYNAYRIPISTMAFKNVTALPYYLYNFSMPATISNVNGRAEFLNLSFDMYSPHNYLAPANYLDSMPLHTGSGFFATDGNGDLVEYPSTEVTNPSNTAFNDPSTDFFTSLSNTVVASLGLLSFLNPSQSQAIGPFRVGQVQEPTYIASSPNDYIYIFNYTSSCGFLCLTSTAKTFLITMRFIPVGYFNMTNYQPNVLENQLFPSKKAYASAWESYWKKALLEQSANLYVTNVTPITSTTQILFGLANVGSSGVTFNSLIPLALTTDYADDKFIVGIDRNTIGANGCSAHFAIPPISCKREKFEVDALLSNGTAITSEFTSGNIGGFVPSSEIAAAPGGQFVYLASPRFGYLAVFSVGSNSISYAGTQSLSYSNSTENFNIAKYLQDGGPFNNSAIANAYAGTPTTNDIQSNHHVIGITDFEGINYILDNWTFTVNGLTSTMLMLRAFTSNGTEIPIDPSLIPDTIAANPAAISTTTGSSGIRYFPPYGWPLSVNISISNNKYVSYCAADCTYTPNTIGSNSNGYEPIGPFINANGYEPAVNDTAFSAAFNGSMMILAHPYIYTSSVAVGFPAKGLYTELLNFKMNLENYTKISLGADAPYNCFISTPVKNTPCIYDTNVADIYPPFEDVPSSFNYVLSRGAPQNFLQLQNLVSSLFPNGITSSQTNNDANTDNGVTSGYQPGTSGTGTANLGTTSLPEYINSSIDGYLLVPYYTKYTLHQQWSPNPDPPNPGSAASCKDYTFNGIQNGNNVGVSYTFNGYSVAQANVSTKSNAINETVAGGATYLEYLPNSNIYAPQISDEFLTLPSIINYKILTNRLLGNITVNNSVTRNGLPNVLSLIAQGLTSEISATANSLSTPYFINSTHNYNYQLLTLDQQTNFNGQGTSEYDGYALQEIMPISPQYGTASSSKSPYSSAFNYTNSTLTTYSQLFSIFTRTSYLNSMLLNVSGNKNIIGYNRLMYKFVDAFNNTIYMPVDLNFANITYITDTANPIVNPINPNETKVKVVGSAGFRSGILGLKYTPLPEGSPIYIYYDTNINYYNSSSTPSSNPTAYYTYALKCAFSTNATGCQYSNPLATITQGVYASEANTINFATSYNSIGPDECANESKSLLAVPISPPAVCNIYGDNGLPSVKYSPMLGAYEYCIPEYANGSGTSFTSQLGLVKTVYTNSTGGFSASFNVCGTGQERVIAQYYGNPPPEPNIIYQPPLRLSNGTNYDLLINEEKTFEYNYSYAPNATVEGVTIGNYALDFGNLGMLATAGAIAIAAALLMFQASRRRAKPGRNATYAPIKGNKKPTRKNGK